MVDAHAIAEQARLLSHRAYADLIGQDASYISRARAIMAERLADGRATAGEKHWSRLLKRPWEEIRRQMLADTPEGRLLRSNSPFSLLIGVRDPDTRRKLWRKAKRDLGRPVPGLPA